MKQAENRFLVYGYVLYFCITFASFLPYVKSDYCYIDELVLMADAKRLLMGDHIHRDFFNHIGSGNFYLVALVWKILGKISCPPIKLLTFVTITLSGLLLVLIARRFTRRFWLSLLPSLIFANYLGHFFPYTNHHWFGCFASILFCFFLVRYLLSFSLWDLYGCGVASGLSLFFLMHEGIMNIMATVLIIAAAWLLLGRRLGSCNPARLALVYFAGLATFMLPVILFYLSIGALGQYCYDTFIWPLGNYARKGSVNDIGWAADLDRWRLTLESGKPLYLLASSAALLLLILPLLAMFVSAGLLISPARLGSCSAIRPEAGLAEQLAAAGETARRRYNYLVVFALTLVAISIYSTPLFSQPGFPKLIWGSMPATLLLVILLDHAWDACADLVEMRRAIGLILAFIFVSVGAVYIYRAVTVASGDETSLVSRQLSPQMGKLSDHPLVDLLNSESGPQDYFFAHKYLGLLYYEVNARPGTRYTSIVEDYLTEAQMRDMFSDLYRKQPKFMVFTNEQDLLWLARQDGNFPDWLNSTYLLRGRIEGLLLYQRK